MMTDDYEGLRDWMRRPDVQAAVERQGEAEEEEEPKPEYWIWTCQWCGMKYPNTIPYCDCQGRAGA